VLTAAAVAAAAAAAEDETRMMGANIVFKTKFLASIPYLVSGPDN
jgi:hypothetical protein